MPGLALGVWHAGQTRLAAFGVTSVENPLPVTEDMLFQIGSLTKTFVGTAVMRLVESGALNLDAPVRAYLPGLQLADESVAARVTLRHLLTHTGGWAGDYFKDFGPGDDALARMVAALVKLPQLAPLGALFSYNNAGFYLAGRVVEVAAGLTFEAALQALVLDPLGLRQTFFNPEDVMSLRFAVGHETVDGQPRVARPWSMPRSTPKNRVATWRGTWRRWSTGSLGACWGKAANCRRWRVSYRGRFTRIVGPHKCAAG